MDGNRPAASNWIDIKAKDGGTFRAYAARPARGSGPGIVVLQEIFGVNANLRRVCDTLAEEGYVAIAPDLFWRIEPGVDLDYSDAGRDKGLALKTRFDMSLAADDVDAAAAALRRLPETVGKIGAVGYCLGGLLAFVAAARGTVDCAVSYYGVGIETRLDLAPALQVPMTFHYGTDDSHVPPAAIEATRKALADRPGAAFPWELRAKRQPQLQHPHVLGVLQVLRLALATGSPEHQGRTRHRRHKRRIRRASASGTSRLHN
jgi:carboxymethylenebutenolidase